MRGIQSAVVACIAGCSLLVLAQLRGPGLDGPGRGPPGKGIESPATATSTVISVSTQVPVERTITLVSTVTPTSTSLTSTSSSITSISSPAASTRTTTIDMSSLLSSQSSISTDVTTSAAHLEGSLTESPVVSMPMSSHPPHATPDNSVTQRKLIIILSVVLGFVGLVLLAAVILLTCRYRRGQSPFGHRGASPINDDEIASWRATSIEAKKPASIRYDNTLPRLGLAHSPGWTWTASPTSVRSSMPYSSPGSPSLIAKAPNSRIGLTDSTVPGADPFLPPLKRQSSRLSKAPPGHARTKSRRSSTSAKSVRSLTGANGVIPELKPKVNDTPWYGLEEGNFSSAFKGAWDGGSSSPGTSIFDGLNATGLSPRPKSQQKPWETGSQREEDIGRAIA